ncbi:MAG: ParB/RepB/Spo0J family partition protein [Chloroflexi bacterium]|nr:ParB/RepB/Spo0J family partition protein [Chloroflexota bacterium]
MPKVKLDKAAWDKAEARTGLTTENAGKPGAVDRILELRRLPVVELALDEITPNPRQPRRSFDANGEGSTLEKLAADIRQNGVLQPILVVQRGPGQFQIVAGERRWRASSLADKLTIPARVLSQERWPRPLDDREIMALSMAENYQRKDLDPWEEAANAKTLGTMGFTQQEIGRIMGRSQSYVSRLLGGLKAAEEIAPEKYASRIISPTVLAEAGAVKDAAARQRLVDKAARGEAGLREVRAAKREADPVGELQRRCNSLVDMLTTIRIDAAAYARQYDELRAILTTTEGEIGRCLEALRQAHKAAKRNETAS